MGASELLMSQVTSARKLSYVMKYNLRISKYISPWERQGTKVSCVGEMERETANRSFYRHTSLNRHVETTKVKSAFNILSGSFPGSDLLTPRERAVLAHLVTGATSKEAGRALGISPRTVDFHRADILKRLNAKNLVDLMRKVSSE
jgi:DNA-binding CsgD family transcriptional regulator